MFDRAIELAGFPPSNLMFVDDRQENIKAAEELGLNTHWFQSVEGLLELVEQLGVDLDQSGADPNADR